MKKIILLLSFLICSYHLSFGQFKTIEGTKGGESNIELNPKIKLAPTPLSDDKSIPLHFKSIPSTSLKSGNSIIKPIYFNEKGDPIYFKGALNELKGLTEREQANIYLARLAEFYGINNILDQVQLQESGTDNLGMVHFNFIQHVDGVPVEGLVMQLHAKNGLIFRANGILKKIEKLENESQLSGLEAETKVQLDLESKGLFKRLKEEKIKELNVPQFTTEHVIVEHNDAYRLSYRIDVYANLMQRFIYYVDAEDGTILNSFKNYCSLHAMDESHSHHLHKSEKTELNVLPPDGPAVANALDLFNISRTLNTYESGSKFYLVDASRTMFNNGQSNMPDEPVGAIWTIDAFNSSPENNNFSYGHVSSSNNSWNNKTAVSAHYNGGIAFEYFKNVHGRNSINGEGGNIVSFINITESNGSGMDNAFWNGVAMFYGNGKVDFEPLAKALDVAGHEMSHGVVQATANLTYQGESGAMNESFADIFGAMMDRDDWKIGEDVAKTSTFPTGALRDMQNPHNGGNSLGDPGWQPDHMNERYTGSQDNGGVHINSGIVNHAFFLFAEAVTKDKAERVYYRALSKYLTKSSKFIDLRAAVEQAAEDLYDSNVVNAASAAFQAVGIGGGGGNTDYENDVSTNPGEEFLVYGDSELNDLYIRHASLTTEETKISEQNILSRPSVTDNGQFILFVGQDKRIYLVTIDWDLNTASTEVFSDEPVWRNVIISKDAKRIAALTDQLTNELIVYDFALDAQTNYELYNPTFSEGVNTGDVEFADAMEFDFTGEYVMYDAQNKINGVEGEIEYWDIGFIHVFNNNSNNFANGEVQKLFSLLPENTSIGNPTFSKNSPYIIAFDYIDAFDYKIYGVNIEQNEVNEIIINSGLSYPSFNKNDNRLVYDVPSFFGTDLGTVNLDGSKIQGVFNSETLIIGDSRLANYMANGDRELVDNKEIEHIALTIAPNPASNVIKIDSDVSFEHYQIWSMDGKKLMDAEMSISKEIDIASLLAGQYMLQLSNNQTKVSKTFVKN